MRASSVRRAHARTQARRIVLWTARAGVADVHAKGFAWFRTRLCPALDAFAATAKTATDRRTLSQACYVVRDVHDWNGAPRAAIAAYRRSLRHDPRQAASWREIGSMQDRMGDGRHARMALRRALALDPEDQCARDDLTTLNEHGATRVYDETDPVWTADELLARGHAQQESNVVSRVRGVRGLLCAARVHGARGDGAAVLRTWDRIARSHGSVELSYGDWFFLPSATFDEPAFWSALWSLGGRLSECVFVRSETLSDARSKERLPGRRSSRSRGTQRLMIRYHLARTRADASSLRRLLSLYPTWKEPRDLPNQMASRGASPT